MLQNDLYFHHFENYAAQAVEIILHEINDLYNTDAYIYYPRKINNINIAYKQYYGCWWPDEIRTHTVITYSYMLVVGFMCISLYVEGILPKGPYLPCAKHGGFLRMAGRALSAGYYRCIDIWVYLGPNLPHPTRTNPTPHQHTPHSTVKCDKTIQNTFFTLE